MGEKNKKDWGISNVPEVITFTDLDKKDGNLVTSIYDSNLGFSYLYVELNSILISNNE